MSAKFLLGPADDRAHTDSAWRHTGLAALVPAAEFFYLALRSIHQINLVDLIVAMGFVLFAIACAGAGSPRLRNMAAHNGEDELALTPKSFILGGTLAITALAVAVLVVIID